MEGEVKMFSVLILHNYETPYRHKLFTELSKHVALTVVYLQNKEIDNRLWSIEATKNYESYHIKSYQVGKLALNRFADLRRLISNGKYDVIFLSDNLPNFFSNMYLSLIGHPTKKLLWSEEVATNPCYPRIKSYFLRVSQMLLKHGVDGIVAFTKAAAAGWRKQINPKRVFYCPQSSLRSEELKFYSIPKKRGELRLLFVGSFTGRKNEKLLCQAVDELARNYNIQLTLIGEGPLRKQLAERYASSAFSFLGWKEHDELSRYYRDHHFLILPSKYDPWGMVVNESMSCGTPCIVSDCVGAKELVKDSGLIVHNLTLDTLKKYILRAYFMNESEYVELRKKAFEYSKQYTIEICTQHILYAIREILNE